jgi:hypothetical protein
VFAHKTFFHSDKSKLDHFPMTCLIFWSQVSIFPFEAPFRCSTLGLALGLIPKD